MIFHPNLILFGCSFYILVGILEQYDFTLGDIKEKAFRMKTNRCVWQTQHYLDCWRLTLPNPLTNFRLNSEEVASRTSWGNTTE